MKLAFTKMEGCGNDYVYISGFSEKVAQEEKPALVRRLSDRHFGIGGDGVIFINPSEEADFEMEMFNADGTRAEMCGNWIRCVGAYVREHGLTREDDFTVVSMGAVKKLHLTMNGNSTELVRVDMGRPILAPADVPTLLRADDGKQDSPVIDAPLTVAGTEYRITCVSMGNPHAVVFLEDGADPADLDLPAIGPLFENHEAFPRRTNTEFVQVLSPSHVKMRVWERGTGETLACGTGCCAIAVAGVLSGRIERKVRVDVLGGTLFIEWDESGTVWMTGPAVTVFEGTVNI
jgi:diaminopimelate epimerase